MPKHGKKYRDALTKVDRARRYELPDAVSLLKGLDTAKFDETVEIAMKLGVDPRKGDQLVRGSVVLPHGTGRTVRVAVFAEGEPGEIERRVIEKEGADPKDFILSEYHRLRSKGTRREIVAPMKGLEVGFW